MNFSHDFCIFLHELSLRVDFSSKSENLCVTCLSLLQIIYSDLTYIWFQDVNCYVIFSF